MKLLRQMRKKSVIIALLAVVIVAAGVVSSFALQPKQNHVALKSVTKVADTSKTSSKADVNAETATPANVSSTQEQASDTTNDQASTQPQQTEPAAPTVNDAELTNTCDGVQKLIQQYYYGPVKYYANFNALLTDTNPSTANRVMPIKVHYQECVDAGKLQPVE